MKRRLTNQELINTLFYGYSHRVSKKRLAEIVELLKTQESRALLITEKKGYFVIQYED